MVNIHSIYISPPLMNASCAWASDLKQLQDLYNSPHTGAVTIRTATLNGFAEDASHTVAFTENNLGLSSLNSFGYSPYPLSTYLSWIEQILAQPSVSPYKPFIISISASDPTSLQSMVGAIQALRRKLHDHNPEEMKRAAGSKSRIAIEFNTSCPNIHGSSPPAYAFHTIITLLQVLSEEYKRDATLTIGLKLAPFVYREQFVEVLDVINKFSFQTSGKAGDKETKNPFAFFTCTNTLGNALLFVEQTAAITPTSASPFEFAVPPVLGGLAGDPIHPLSLGNVYTFASLLQDSKDEGLRAIRIIGVGGVTSREAAERMRKAGATVVACATFFGREGVRAFEILAREGYR